MTASSVPLTAPWVRRLTSAEPPEAALVGRKALSLAELMAAGLPVPEAFAVTTRAYELAIAPFAPLVEAAVTAP
ncbi:MAG: hypothetical protein ACLGIN_00945, partial [Candidatus Sericytochromatia bacterium]